MSKLKIEDLAKIQEQTKKVTNIRDGAGRGKIVVHMGTCGIAAGARDVMSALLAEISKQNISDVIVTTSGCAGLCSREPMVTIEMTGESPIKYGDLTDKKIIEVLNKHVLGGEVLSEYAIAVGSERTH